jgi:flagellar biosynthetic protein FliP
VIDMFSALAFVLGAIALLGVALRAFGFAPPRGARRSLRVLESCALGQRQRLLLVEAQGERLLLAAGEGSVRLLRRLPPAPPEAEPAPAQPPRRLRAARAWLRAVGLTALALCVLAGPALAQEADVAAPAPGASSLSLSLDGPIAPERIAGTLQIVALVTLLSVAPSILLMATCFTRIVIVLSLLRQAIGIHQLPPNQVIVGLALFTTLFVMAPVGAEIKSQALDPYVAGELDEAAALEKALSPVRAFMSRHTRQKDLALFVSMSSQPPPESLEDVSLATLLPSFLISEIRAAFEIGFMVYLPFLIVDIVIASMLISMGMIVLPPIIISLPFKLMLFVLLDGWNLVLSSLITGLR